MFYFHNSWSGSHACFRMYDDDIKWSWISRVKNMIHPSIRSYQSWCLKRIVCFFSFIFDDDTRLDCCCWWMIQPKKICSDIIRNNNKKTEIFEHYSFGHLSSQMTSGKNISFFPFPEEKKVILERENKFRLNFNSPLMVH